jgi:hypothetical protein
MRLLTANNIQDDDENDRRGAGSFLANEEVIRVEAKRAITWVKAFFCFSSIGILGRHLPISNRPRPRPRRRPRSRSLIVAR